METMNLPTEDGPAVETIEDVGGEFGFRIVWECKTYWADFKVWQIVGREHPGREPLFRVEAGASDPTTTEWTRELPTYLEGFVKWDGCSEFDFNDTHFCGAEAFVMHFALLKHLYLRAGELCGHNHVESPWPSVK